MKLFTSSVIPLGLAIIFLSSCQSSSDLTSSSIIQKRRYTKGYNLNLKTSVSKEKANTGEILTKRAEVMEEPGSHTINGVGTFASTKTEISDAELSSNRNAKISEKYEDQLVHAMATPTFSDSKEMKSKRELKRSIRKQRAELMGENRRVDDSELVLYIILAIILPPLAVGLLYGISGEFWISLLLTIIFYIPGMIYALIKVLQH